MAVSIDDCHLYAGRLDPHGYGVLSSWQSDTQKNQNYRVVRLVMDVPDGMVADHLCNNPPCINPEHLEIVTIAENVRRGKSGKLSYGAVSKIRELYATGLWRQHQLAKKFGVGQDQISRIVNKKRWSIQ